MSARLAFLAALALSFAFTAPAADAAGTFTYAKLAVYYDGASQVLSKGVKKVTNPQTGVYCVKTAFKKAYNFMGIAGIEGDTSNGNDLLAQWIYGAGNCPNQDRWLEVQTFDQNMGGNWVLTNDASWVLYVP